MKPPAASSAKGGGSAVTFTEKDRRVLRLIYQDFTYKEVSDCLTLAIKTIEHHIE